MSKNNYFAQLRMRFFEKGISRQKSDHLIEELQDHFALKIKEFQEQGNNPANAERLAIELVGTPEAVAESAAAELRTNSRLLRVAWSLCVGGGAFIVCFALQFGIAAVVAYFSGSIQYFHNGREAKISLPVLQSDSILFNWLPLLIGMGVLALLIRFSSIGWKSIFFASIAIGVAASVMEQWASPTKIFLQDGFERTLPMPHLNFNIFLTLPIQDWTRYQILHLFTPPYSYSNINRIDIHARQMMILKMTITSLIKMVAPLGMCLFARYVQPRLVRHPSASPG